MNDPQTIYCKRISKLMANEGITLCDDCVPGQDYISALEQQVSELKAENKRLILEQGHVVADTLKDRINGVDPDLIPPTSDQGDE